ncbi:PREDICTED: gastrula zinc finger protein XlCGF8.2DB-like [Polistes dominula]|uniref:Gastrula zinc finger protein XlCGF8.2DB-like n=1 Tax=Polistes dominula TaxID=743375 RepID=A0ABM1IEF3_POLDO|nr:PREDICTED: gastrula zinc finger protein XlCGF8.2DB-like [Polistes dominula]
MTTATPTTLSTNVICKYRPAINEDTWPCNNNDNRTYSSIRLSSRHIKNDDKKPFRCHKCGRGFTLKRNMDRHVNYECGHEPRFQCPYCGLRSKQTSPVYAHIRKKHPEEEVFIFDMKL